MNEETQIQESGSTRELPKNLSLKNIQVELGELDTQWANFDLYSAPIFYNDASGKQIQSQYKGILKSDRLVAIMGKRYQLLPNEVALELTNDIAKKAGFKLHETHYSRSGNYVCATYLNEEKFTFDINEDADSAFYNGAKEELNQNPNKKVGDVASGSRAYGRAVDRVAFGFTMRNSIDGSSGFAFGGKASRESGLSFGLFSYRLSCSNGAIARHVISDVSNIQKQEQVLKAYVKHTGTDKDKFYDYANTALQGVEKQILALANVYRQWRNEMYGETIAQKIAKLLPKKYLPDYINLEDGKATLEVNGTKWELFNDLTDAIWHSESLDIRSKDKMTSELHRILQEQEPVVERV